jgi:hypothetical protein
VRGLPAGQGIDVRCHDLKEWRMNIASNYEKRNMSCVVFESENALRTSKWQAKELRSYYETYYTYYLTDMRTSILRAQGSGSVL